MAREHIEQEPHRHNSWRPSDGPLPHRGLQQSSVQSESIAPSRMTARASHLSLSQPLLYDSRLVPVTHGTSEPPRQAFKNPNLIPVVSRRPQNTKVASPKVNLQQHGELEEERLPQIWHPSIDDLMRRTAHDYDMVMNYERDAEGGQRWLSEDIATIRDVGKRLHSDIFALRHWQRVIAQQGDQDKKMMQQVKRDANFLKLLCERIQRAINRYEQKCEFELMRDGVYAQDEDGNFYKPIAPHQYVAGVGFLQDVTRPSIEITEGDRPSLHDDRAISLHKECYDKTTGPEEIRMIPEEAQRSPKYPPKRNPAFDFASRQAPFDEIKTEAACQSAPRRSDRVLDARISKARRDVPPGKAPFPFHQLFV
ncbi:hypothetical protein ST47_g4599 [Ascochyta rabiei]|uniref:Uncharacterized protein n=1 Tax=Didymella rabiei TaxID=5454 RepID=A0A163FCT8_DIDRA|nr:hypothetical protein ST47_g4599 [Ascochyta rabiei]